MIVHVVLFQPRVDLDAAARDALLEGLAKAAKEIRSIRRLRVGRRIHHSLPGYEQAMMESYDYALIAEFEDREGLIAYLKHPAHQSIGGHFTASAQRSLAYDYEMLDVGEGATFGAT
jgi:hypothetical protein